MKKRLLLVLGVLLVMASCMKEGDDLITVEETIERDDKTIQDFFKANEITDTIADESGVYIKIIEEGTGDSPSEDNVVRVEYSYYSLPSNKLVSEVKELSKLELDRVLEGLSIGIPYMTEGGVADIYVPCRYAFYGTNRAESNSVLRFRISLYDIAEDISEMDDRIIQEYFVANEITDAIKDEESGVYIQHLKEGEGEEFPKVDEDIQVNYTMYTLVEGDTIEKSKETRTFKLSSLINGWKVGVPLMKKGGKAILYIPSSSAYRESNYSFANKVLKYEIELVDF